MVRRLAIPNDTREFGERGVLPNEEWPSDHLGLVAELEMVQGEGDGEKEKEGGEEGHLEGVDDCRCGCMPKGLPMSLFEMNKRRKAWREKGGGRENIDV